MGNQVSNAATGFLSAPSLHVDWKIMVIGTLLTYEMYRIVTDKFIFPSKAEDDAIAGDASPGAYKEPVHLFVFRGSGESVSSSPFSTKVSMYCRLTGIPHTVSEADMSKGVPKGKVPFLTHNGHTVGDSQLMLRYLENTFDVAAMARAVSSTYTSSSSAFLPFAELTPQQQATCEQVRLLCEGQLYWAVCSMRWFGDVGIARSEAAWHATVKSYFGAIPAAIRGILVAMIRKEVHGAAWAVGTARHSPDDQLYLAKRAVKALSVTLGEQSFMLGQHPSEADCIAFGTTQSLLDTSKWPSNPLVDYVRAECPNLVAYNARLKEAIFPDMCSDSGDVTLPASKPAPTEPLPYHPHTTAASSPSPSPSPSPAPSADTSPKLRSNRKSKDK